MIFQCNECWHRFDADSDPETCPFCGAADGFAQIRITDKTGRELTYKEHIEETRRYYLAHPPIGVKRKDILAMTPNQLEDMDDIMSELDE